MRLESLQIPLGTAMPDFELKDPLGRIYRGNELPGEAGLLVAFTCNHCPYAIAVWPRLIRLAGYGEKLKIKTVAINPNIHPAYPDDAPPKMIDLIHKLKINFPYLVDETQQTARDFRAQCTPDVYLFDKNRKLAYHGRIDDSWKDESQVKCEELKEAMDRLASGQRIDGEQTPSMGCSIKWRDQ